MIFPTDLLMIVVYCITQIYDFSMEGMLFVQLLFRRVVGPLKTEDYECRSESAYLRLLDG